MDQDWKSGLEDCIGVLRDMAAMSDQDRVVVLETTGGYLQYLRNNKSSEIDINYVCKRINQENIYSKVFLLNWIYSITKDSLYIEKLLTDVLESELNCDERWFLYYQITSLFFRNPEYELTDKIEDLLDDLFQSVTDWYLKGVHRPLERIPSGERNKDFILVVTGQTLALQHGPTKTTLDRCQILMKDMKKDVLLINSGSCMPLYGIVPVMDVHVGNYLDEYKSLEYMDYEDVKIPFYQMENRLPTLDEMDRLIDIVRENRPYQIVSIGNSFLEEILNKLVPAIHISLAPSKMGRTFVDYQQIGRSMDDSDRRFLKHRGLKERHVITDVFTSHLAPQKSFLTREELKLPPEGHIAVVIGARLYDEITERFVQMLKPCMDEGLYLLVLGDIDSNIDQIRDWFGDAKDRLITPGLVKDPMAYMDHCYIYINPHRMGGGTSSVEAMFKGVPPITTQYGDVYVNVGDDFSVRNYDEMRDEILHYLSDEGYRDSQSKKARKRADRMLDSSSAFIRVMNEFEKRMLEDEEES